MQTCKFCTEPIFYDGKCTKHRYRLPCSVQNCRNQTYARNLCVQHGGKQQCQYEGCEGNARRFGYCCKHSQPKRKTCNNAGCSNVAHARGMCVKHGGGRRCRKSGCNEYARHEGLCQSHYQMNVPNEDQTITVLTTEELELLATLFKDDFAWTESTEVFEPAANSFNDLAIVELSTIDTILAGL